jgi:hypothetical protein
MIQEKIPRAHYRREWVASGTGLDTPKNITEFARKTNPICLYYS